VSAAKAAGAVLSCASTLIYIGTRMYMNFAVLQLCWFIGNSLFEIGWEMCVHAFSAPSPVPQSMRARSLLKSDQPAAKTLHLEP